ncbi:ABC transporter ATP-binding protein [Aliarcobacter skirrowii]|uniref:metal ABC transporter ATP-binding protein n=1 Tax=Aliarcobacter skirrowii TaxID=28200 RepID=UPI0029B300EF|nr:ABC transporter ATP-binding protein [Aliarcobacter skirrowii]MDX4025404.1 ABC transporter ATP-binding protein [Aliarcobacter skirrowii]MDX4058268.1 ABC transporter ATP-binding protein [Aliarcobacter skirrowii]MDX4070558.1 ABC transporter ATP-binding protein [Aliarcobacter skirrowii]
MDLIKIKNLFFKYQKTDILENVNLTIKDDDFLAIIGPNGGGKSTLLKLILGLLPLQSGKIEKYIKNSQIGYVPQNTNLNIDFPITALEVVLMGHVSSKKRIFGYSKDEISCALESLNQVGMKDYANKKIGDLSGGQRQRVFIARALCSNPKIMLLDEPTASIDVQGQQEIYELLRELNKSICIVVVSHDLSILLNYAKNVAHINRSLVYHSLDEVQKNVTLADDHLCEVELLSALGKTQMCCNHVH